MFPIIYGILFGKRKNSVLVLSAENVFQTFRKAILLTLGQVAAMFSSIPTPALQWERPTGNKAQEIKIRFEPDAWSWSCQCWNHPGVPLSLLRLLKFGSYLWPKVESRCRAACNDLQSSGTDRLNKGKNTPFACSPFGAGVHKAWNLFANISKLLTVVSEYLSRWKIFYRASGYYISRLKTDHVKHKQHGNLKNQPSGMCVWSSWLVTT